MVEPLERMEQAGDESAREAGPVMGVRRSRYQRRDSQHSQDDTRAMCLDVPPERGPFGVKIKGLDSRTIFV